MTQVNELANEITVALEGYSQVITDSCKEMVEVVAKEAMQEIKDHVTFSEPTGKYVKSFRLKTTENSKYNKTMIWHVANGQYRLTHLLEKGHALRNGGRSKEFPHIKYGEILAQKRLVELMKGVIDNLNHY